MNTTYAVKWREPDGQTYLGRLALGARILSLEGRGANGPAVTRQIGYEEILGIGGRGADRLDGQPALTVERADGRYLVSGAGLGAGAGVVQEVVDRLADLRGDVLEACNRCIGLPPPSVMTLSLARPA